ncbi:MAG: MFS transporter [Thalassobaculaceae bacterium]
MPDRDEDRLLRWSELLGPDYRIPTIMIGLGILLNAINFFVFSALAPSVVQDIGGLELLPWATTLYVVSSIVSSAAGGLVRARIGSRRALTISIIGFAAGSAAIGLAPTMPWLLAARVLQGLGAGLLLANSHGLIRDLYPPKSWARLFAAVSGTWGIAALSGPMIGGIFAELNDWRWGFFTMVPVSAVFLILVLRSVTDRDHEDKGGLTPVFRLALIGLAALLVGATGKGADAQQELALTAAALAALVAAVVWERRSSAPIFPRDMFRPSTPLGAGACFFFFVSMGTVATGVYGPYFLQLLHGVPPLAAGYTVTIQSVSWTTAAIVLSGLAGVRARTAIIAGPIITATGCVGTVLFLPQGPLPLAVLSIAVLGFGIGTAWGHVAKRVFDAAGEADRDRVGTTMPTMQSLGMAFGAAAVGVVGDRVGLSGTPEPAVIEAAARWTYLALLPAVGLGILGAMGNALRPIPERS